MNQEDTNKLTEYWHQETGYLNDKVDNAFKSAQDHAYALGLKRGKAEVADLAMFVKRLSKALKECNKDNTLPETAMDYLKSNGLEGSPLRDA